MTRLDIRTERLPQSAGRVVAVLFAVAAATAFASAAIPGSRTNVLMTIGAVDVVVAAIAWWLPWPQAGRPAVLAIVVVGLTIIGVSIWATGSDPAGFVPFFVLLFVWVGLYQPRGTSMWLSPLLAAAYVIPLVVSGRQADEIGSAAVVVPVVVVVGEVIARQVAALQTTLKEVRQAERWRSDIMSTLAHDVRSPLSTIEGTLRLLHTRLGEIDSATQQRLLDAAIRQTRRIERLATGLLDLDRVETGVLKIHPGTVQVARAATEAASYAGETDVYVAVPPDITVWADALRLEQILVNLITNARRHGQPPIEVTATQGPDSVHIAVRDHGGGVPLEAQAGLFERFTASDTAPRSVGLGLWIVRQLVQAHGGTITYEDARPGARFIIRLPRQPPGSAAEGGSIHHI